MNKHVTVLRVMPPLTIRVNKLVRGMLQNGENPDWFWPPQREDALRRLLDEDKFEDANRLLDEALKDYLKGATAAERSEVKGALRSGP